MSWWDLAAGVWEQTCFCWHIQDFPSTLCVCNVFCMKRPNGLFSRMPPGKCRWMLPMARANHAAFVSVLRMRLQISEPSLLFCSFGFVWKLDIPPIDGRWIGILMINPWNWDTPWILMEKVSSLDPMTAMACQHWDAMRAVEANICLLPCRHSLHASCYRSISASTPWMFILDSPIKTSISGYFPATRHDDTQASHQKGPTCYFAVDCSGWICTDSQCRPVQFTAAACCEMSISILSNYSNSRSCRSCDHMLALKCKHQRCCFTCHQLHYGPSMAQHCITASCKFAARAGRSPPVTSLYSHYWILW